MIDRGLIKERDRIFALKHQIDDFIELSQWRVALDSAKALLTEFGIDYCIEDIVLNCDLSEEEVATLKKSSSGADVYCAGMVYAEYPEYDEMTEQEIVSVFRRASDLGISRALLQLIPYDGTITNVDELYYEVAMRGCLEAYSILGQILITADIPKYKLTAGPRIAARFLLKAYLYGFDVDQYLQPLFRNHTTACISLYRPGLIPFSWLPKEYRDRVKTTLLVLQRKSLCSYLKIIICDYVCS
jgi:hypothetical protein